MIPIFQPTAQLQWARPARTTTEPDQLQQRWVHTMTGEAEWRPVPLMIVAEETKPTNIVGLEPPGCPLPGACAGQGGEAELAGRLAAALVRIHTLERALKPFAEMTPVTIGFTEGSRKGDMSEGGWVVTYNGPQPTFGMFMLAASTMRGGKRESTSGGRS